MNGPIAYGMFFSSTESGSSYQVTNWSLQCPERAFHGHSADEGEGPARADTGPGDRPDTAHAHTAPPAGIAWPPVNDPTAHVAVPEVSPVPDTPGSGCVDRAVQLRLETCPAGLQAQALRLRRRRTAPYPGVRHTLAGFGAMDWSEASYFGLNASNVQNAAGISSPPRRRRSMPLLTDATSGPNGIFSTTTTTLQTRRLPDAARHLRVGLDQVSARRERPGRGGPAHESRLLLARGRQPRVPTGYVPLPDNLYNSARTEISDAFPNAEKTCNGPTPPFLRSGKSKGSVTGRAQVALGVGVGIGMGSRSSPGHHRVRGGRSPT